MQVQQMNRVQRRLWRAFMSTGADTGDQAMVNRLQRLVQDHVNIMTPALRHVMQSVLFTPADVNYGQLAHEIVTLEGVRISPAALRKRVSRAVKMLEQVIHEVNWEPPEGVPRLGIQPKR